MPITSSDGWKQFWMDLKGKDSFRGVSLSYAWMANQMGHMLLGLVLSAIIYSIIRAFGGSGNEEVQTIWAITIMIILWTIFESWNVYSTLNDARPDNPYGIPWFNVLDDMSVDIIFFFIGGGIFGIIKTPSLSLVFLIFFLVMVIIIYLVGVRWFFIKMRLQIPGFPLQFRLGQWNNNFATSEFLDVKRFMGADLITHNNFRGIFGMAYERLAQIVQFTSAPTPTPFPDAGRHLLIFGKPMSGKSKLGIGCAYEFAINGRQCAYTTSEDIYYHMQDKVQITKRKTNYNLYWVLQEAEVIVIDDINPTLTSPAGATPRTTSKFINALIADPIMRDNFFLNKSLIWIFNTPNSHFPPLIPPSPRDWMDIFENQLGVVRAPLVPPVVPNPAAAVFPGNLAGPAPPVIPILDGQYYVSENTFVYVPPA